MKLNGSKTAAVINDFGKEKVISPENCLKFNNGEPIKIVCETKYLGFQFTSDLSLDSFIKARRDGGLAALWDMRRICTYEVKREILTSFYKSFIQSRLEFAIPSIHSAMTDHQKVLLESVQKKATKVILRSASFLGQKNYLCYNTRLQLLGLEELSTRMSNLSNCFYRKLEFSDKFYKYFKPNSSSHAMFLRRPKEYALQTSRTT